VAPNPHAPQWTRGTASHRDGFERCLEDFAQPPHVRCVIDVVTQFERAEEPQPSADVELRELLGWNFVRSKAKQSEVYGEYLSKNKN